MTDHATPSADAPEVLQRLVAAHERMMALAEKIAVAKAEAEPKLALEAMDRVEALGKGVRFCLMLREKLAQDRAKAPKPTVSETLRRKAYLRAALPYEHMKRHEREPREVERMLSLFEADGSLNIGGLLDALRRACKFLDVPMPEGLEADARRLAETLAQPQLQPPRPAWPPPQDAHGRAVTAIHAARPDSS
jgi:hypothetical protein